MLDTGTRVARSPSFRFAIEDPVRSVGMHVGALMRHGGFKLGKVVHVEVTPQFRWQELC